TQPGDRTIEWRSCQRQCSTYRDHGNHVRTKSRIHAEHAGNTLYLMAVALGPQGPDGPVNDPADEHCIITWSALALDRPTATDFAGCIHFLFVINTEREIVHSLNSSFADHCRAEHDGITVACQD